MVKESKKPQKKTEEIMKMKSLRRNVEDRGGYSCLGRKEKKM